MGALLLEIVPYLARTRDVWGARTVPADWQAVVDGMTPVQKTVHLAGRRTDGDAADLGRRLFDEGRETYRQALQNELNRWGCAGQQALAPSAGPELSAIRERADWAAEGVGHTYNLELAREIVRIGEETPRANRHVYAHRLFYREGSWDGRYWERKAEQVAQIETMTMVNAGVADFYARNGDVLTGEAVVQPFSAVCPVCQEMVGKNPYRSVDEIYRAYAPPVHIGCPHHAVASETRRLSHDECRMLWAGG